MSIETASIVITPNAYKASKLYALKPTNGSGDLDVVRATTATRVNSNGLIETVALNVPRIDYTGGGCPKILVEPQRTTLVFPRATATTQTRTVTAVAHTLSFYGTGNVVLSGVHSATLTGTGANNRVTLTFTPTAGSLTLTVNGDVRLWQLEAGSNATSVIDPFDTVASAVTRNADVISKTGISDLIGQTEGTIFVDFENSHIQTSIFTVRRLFAFTDGTSNNRIQATIIEDSLPSINFSVVNGGVVQHDFNFTGSVIGRFKAVLIYKNNNISFFLNGVKLSSKTTSSTIPATSRIDLGNQLGSQIANLNFNSFYCEKTAISDAKAIEMTTL